MRRWRRLTAVAAAISALLIAGCDIDRAPDPVGPVEEPIMVHSILRPGSDTASVLVTRAPVGEDPVPQDVRRVSGASVRITVGSEPDAEAVELGEAPDGFGPCFSSGLGREPDAVEQASAGCYAGLLPGPVRPGRTYGLEVGLPEHGPIEGTAVVPHPPELGAPVADAKIELDVSSGGPSGPTRYTGAFPVAWAASGAVAAVDLELESDGVWRGDARLEGAECTFGTHLGDTADAYSPYVPPTGRPPTDSTRFWLDGFLCREPAPADSAGMDPVEDWDSAAVRLHVMAYDTAYARYRTEVLRADNGTVSEPKASAGLRGAAGVFSGVAVVERRVILVPAPETP